MSHSNSINIYPKTRALGSFGCKTQELHKTTVIVTSRHLFLEVTDGELVGERQEVSDAVTYVVVLQVVHQVSAVAL